MITNNKIEFEYRKDRIRVYNFYASEISLTLNIRVNKKPKYHADYRSSGNLSNTNSGITYNEGVGFCFPIVDKIEEEIEIVYLINDDWNNKYLIADGRNLNNDTPVPLYFNKPNINFSRIVIEPKRTFPLNEKCFYYLGEKYIDFFPNEFGLEDFDSFKGNVIFKLERVFPYTTIELGKLLQESVLDWHREPVMTLYNTNSENIVVNKELINSYTIYDATFRDSISVTNPVFLIEYDSIFNYNYCYITSFNRYYYIDEIVNVRTNIWEIHCSVDTLMSFKEDIRKQTAIISRATKHRDLTLRQNPYIYDELTPFESVRRITTNFIDLSYLYKSSGFFAVNIMAKGTQDSRGVLTDNNRSFLMDRTSFKEFVKFYSTYTDERFTNFSEAIISIFWFPMDIEDIDGQKVTKITLLNGSEINISVGTIKEVFTNSIFTENFFINIPIDNVYRDNFIGMNLTHRDVYLYTSLTGHIKINPYYIKNQSITMQLVVDSLTGSCSLTLSSDFPFFTTNINLGYSISIGRTNFADIQRDLYSIQSEYKIDQVRVTKNAVSSVMEDIAGAFSLNSGKKKGLIGRIANLASDVGQDISNTIFDSSINDMVRLKNSRIAEQPEFSASKPIGTLTQISEFFRTVYIQQSFPIIISNHFNDLVGVAVNEYGLLEEYHGYTVVNSIRLKDIPYALNSEKEQIKNYLQTGVILP